MTFSLQTFARLFCWAATVVVVGAAAPLVQAEPSGAASPVDGAAVEQVIDYRIGAKLQQEGVIAAEAADDATLVRRLTLDFLGRIPTVAEARQYVESSASDKRAELVDRLMASPEYAQHAADEFDALLMDETSASLRDYLLAAFSERRSWDVMFRQMLLGEEDDGDQSGAIQFVRARAQDLDKLTNDASVLFFGVNVSCAKCHDHPLVGDWTQDHFYGMKSFFGRTFENGGFVGERDYGTVDYQTTGGQSRLAPVMFLSGREAPEPPSPMPDEKARKEEKSLLEQLKKDKQPPPAPSFSRRRLLVETALAPDERDWFARAAVNHVWRRFFGRGLVSPVDQMHSENPPSHPELLDALAQDFVAHGYHLARLERGIAMSAAYGRSSRWQNGERPDPALFAVAQVRPLSPMQYSLSLHMGASSPDRYENNFDPGEVEQRLQQIRNHARGLAKQFDQPRGDFQVSAAEALLLSNGEVVRDQLLRESSDSLIGKIAAMENAAEIVENAVWAVYSRPPHAEEFDLLSQFVAEREDRRLQACRQLVWALLASSESRFNH